LYQRCADYDIGSALQGTPPIIVADFGFDLISTTSSTNSEVTGLPYVSNPSIYNPLSSLLNFPVVGPSQSFVNRAGFLNIPYMTNTLTQIRDGQAAAGHFNSLGVVASLR
jgi:hypothetical protein